MNILITGCAGFIGSNLIDRLISQNNNVVGVDNFDSFYDIQIKRKNIENALFKRNFKFYEGDIRDADFLSEIFQNHKIDIVVHLAAKAGVRPSIESPKDYYDTNVIGTLNLLEAMRISGIRKIVFASSSSVYGNNSKVPFSEFDNVDYPISPYAATKKAGELLCHSYHHLYQFDVHCLRFFTVYGPRQRPDLAIHKFINLIQENHPIPFYGDGSTKRDYTYIEDILDGIIQSINRVSGYEIINLGESRTISLNDLIYSLETLLNKKILLEKLPLQAGDVNITFADITKAKQLLDYNPKWDFIDGLREFVKWKELR